MEMAIGSVDVKSSPVYFYAQRYSDYIGDGKPMTFDFARTNIGGAMNTSSGIFTAPKSGIYLFSFSGLKGNVAVPLYLNLILNDYIVGSSFAGASTDFSTISLVSTLHLRAGDNVSLKTNVNGILDDNSAGPYTHFSGILLQEDLFQ
jgi:C1q-related factor